MIEKLFTLIVNSAVVGVGATAVMDIWALTLQKIFGIPPLNFAMVGRWLAYIPKGVFRHDNIGSVKPATAELVIGWAAHYLIGIIFAALLIMFTGFEWLNNPSIVPAIVFGLLTVGFPFFIMQPCLGLGMAAAKTPKPNVARLRSLLTHFIFGLGLYVSAILASLF